VPRGDGSQTKSRRREREAAPREQRMQGRSLHPQPMPRGHERRSRDRAFLRGRAQAVEETTWLEQTPLNTHPGGGPVSGTGDVLLRALHSTSKLARVLYRRLRGPPRPGTYGGTSDEARGVHVGTWPPDQIPLLPPWTPVRLNNQSGQESPRRLGHPTTSRFLHESALCERQDEPPYAGRARHSRCRLLARLRDGGPVGFNPRRWRSRTPALNDRETFAS